MQTSAPSEAKFQQGLALHQQGRSAEALAYYDQALALDPGHADALFRRGCALYELGAVDAAADSFARTLALAPAFAPAHNGLGLALTVLGRPAAALESYNTAVRLEPNFASPYINRSIVLRDMGRLDDALASLNRAIVLAPDNANAHGNRGTVLTELKQPTAAVASLDRALQLNPGMPFLAGVRLLNKMQICDWSNFDRELADLCAKLARGEPASPTWPLLGLTDSAQLQRTAAESWTRAKCPENPSLGPLAKYPRHERIKLGYFSADFHRHATAYLIAELFERHDRAKFELFAFSFGPANGDDMQQRLKAACDHFIDESAQTDRDVAAYARAQEIDIAVDLKGFSVGNRIGIFAHRAAPIQVNYLGYPCTLGAPYIDYIIADEIIIPKAAEKFYTEKLVTLPNSYQVNDRQRKIAARSFTRAELGLPETGFVFCSFNNNYKITPNVFDVWMRLLTAVEGSVLWLLEDNPTAAVNLRREAARRNVDAGRLIFAGRIAPEEHLARQRSADLFLDTLPCNAHTTASDALWVGLPVLTCPGGSFTSRVAASLLHAVGLPEMIAPTLAEYETLALALARDSARLESLRQKLKRDRLSSPLFDSALFARHIEGAYTRMFEDYHARPTG